MAPTMTRWPTAYSFSRPAPSASITPTGSCPSTRPGRTGYSPFTMCTSVPQIVVVVIRITAWPARGTGFGRSSMASVPTPRKATAFMVAMTPSPLPSDRDHRHPPLLRLVQIGQRGAEGPVRDDKGSARRTLEDAVGHTSEKESSDHAVTVRADDDEVAGVVVDVLQDLIGGRAHQHRRGHAAVEPAIGEEMLQHALCVRGPHLAQLAEVHSRALDHPRLGERIGHHVHDMDLGAGVAGQGQGDVERFERCRTEIRGTKNSMEGSHHKPPDA